MNYNTITERYNITNHFYVFVADCIEVLVFTLVCRFIKLQT